MTEKTIEAQEVKPGMFIYDPGYYAPDKWRQVTATELHDWGNDHTVGLKVGVSAHKHIDTRSTFAYYPRQAVRVRYLPNKIYA